jgi:hypothetical protein
MPSKSPRASIGCEALESRRLLATTLIVNDTPAIDTIIVGVTPAGGISTNVNGQQKDYAPGEWDALLVQSGTGADTINVRATVVPSVVHYIGASRVRVNVGDPSGVQNIKAPLNVNGAVGGPTRGGSAAIEINDTGDATARNVVLTSIGSKQIITGLAPAEISIGVEVEPVGPGGAFEADTLALTSGTGADAIRIQKLRYGLPTTLFSANGNDAIVVGDGSLAGIYSPITVWGRLPGGIIPANMTLKLDDSNNATAAQFTLSVILPPGPGPMEIIDFEGAGFSKQQVTFRVADIAAATIDAGAASDKFMVHDISSRLEAQSLRLTLNTGAGDDQAAVDKSDLGTSLLVNGQAGDDTLKIGPIGPFDGVSGDLQFVGGDGTNTLIVQGPKASPLDIPSVPVIVTSGHIQHRNVEFSYAGVSKLQLQNGWFNINQDLGGLDLTITSEPSSISFESSTSVQINSNQKLGALTLISGPVELSAGRNKLLECTSLDIKDQASLDLTDNAMHVHYNLTSPLSGIRKWIFARRIFSGLADTRHNLGYTDQSGGIDFAPFGKVVVQYTLYGDANLDGRVNFADLVVLARHYGDNSGNANWDQGDFTYDGKVGFEDLTLLAQNYNQTMQAAAVVASSAPEAAKATAPAPRRRPYLRPR